jgi:O-succinylbenzoic acid--CoA ligase
VGIELVSRGDVLSGLERALAGNTAIGVLPEQGQASYADMLRPEVPLEYPAGAVIVSSSGSTGAPKGVVLSAAAILASVSATHARLGGPGHWVCALPTHNVAGLMTLARGLVGEGVSFCRSDLSDLPTPATRSYLSVVPAQLFRALDDPSVADRLGRFAAVLIGGQSVPDALLKRASGLGIRLVTSYGMSETCGGCVYDGVPLDKVSVELVPGTDQAPSRNEARRILLTTPTAFLGYRLNPELTSEVLAGQTVRTQDRGELVDGKLKVLGRFDDVVISGGVNVDLAEVQAVCDQVFGAGELRVFSVPDERWGASVVALTSLDIGQSTLRTRLADRLEPAAIPRAVRGFVGQEGVDTGKIPLATLREIWSKGDNGDSC